MYHIGNPKYETVSTGTRTGGLLAGRLNLAHHVPMALQPQCLPCVSIMHTKPQGADAHRGKGRQLLLLDFCSELSIMPQLIYVIYFVVQYFTFWLFVALVVLVIIHPLHPGSIPVFYIFFYTSNFVVIILLFIFNLIKTIL